MINPLMLTAIGRSGTTYMMRLLAQHPQIVVFTSYPLEVRLFQYAVYGDNRCRETSAHALNATLDSPLSLMDVQNYYKKLAAETGKMPLLFAEKHLPRLNISLALEMAPQLVQLTLVRDPRDVLFSARAFNAKRGFKAFQERDGDTDLDVVLKYHNLYSTIIDGIRARPSMPWVRYEDLITSPDATLAWVFSKLGVDFCQNAIATILATTLGYDPAHQTSGGGIDSIYRWRRELSPHLYELYETHFATINDFFGYS